jgi:hypothetical protein
MAALSVNLRSDDYNYWLKRESGTTRHLFGGAANAGVIVAVGEQETVLSSTDGLTWRAQTLTSNTLYAVDLLVYRHPDGSWDPVSNSWKQKTNFVAVGQGGCVAASDDGALWQVGSFDLDVPVYGIASSGYKLAAVGPQIILLSGNGLAWGAELTIGRLYGVGTSPAQSLAVVGADGLLWTKAGDQDWRDSYAPTTKTLTSLVTYNGILVAAGDDGALLRGIYSSSDGQIQWTLAPAVPGCHFKAVTAAGGYFFAVGSDRSTAEDYKFGTGVPGNGVLMTSTDGLNWTKRDVGRAPGLYSVRPFKGSVFAFGEGGTILQNSADAGPPDPLDSWNSRLSNTTNTLNSVAFGNGTFVAVGEAGTILTSTDGVAWNRQDSRTTGSLSMIRFLDGDFVAVGDPFLISRDGIHWTQAVRGGTGGYFGDGFSDVTRGPEGFFAVGIAKGSPSTFFPLIAKSADGLTWTSESWPEFTEVWGGVVYGNGMYLAVGTYVFAANSTVYTSTDLITWTRTNVDFHAFPRFGPGYFLLLGMFGDRRASTTTDATTFETAPVTFSNSSDATYGNGTWVAVGLGGALFSSSDGRVWYPRPSGTTVNLRAVAYGAGTFVAVGENGLILQSGRAASGASLLSRARFNGAGGFVFVLDGEAGRQYAVQTSDDLSNWVNWTTAAPGQTWTVSPSNSARFYRALPVAP